MYEKMIREVLAQRGRLDRVGDAAMIEALMRADPNDGGASMRTLDGLSPKAFAADAVLFADAITEDRVGMTELAVVYGWTPA